MKNKRTLLPTLCWSTVTIWLLLVLEGIFGQSDASKSSMDDLPDQTIITFVSSCPITDSCRFNCSPIIACTNALSEVPLKSISTCSLDGSDAKGVCCSTVERVLALGSSIPLHTIPASIHASGPPGMPGPTIRTTTRKPQTSTVKFGTRTEPHLGATESSITETSTPKLDTEVVEKAFENASANAFTIIKEQEKSEQESIARGNIIEPNSTDDLHSQFTQADPEGLEAAAESLVALLILHEFLQQLNESVGDFEASTAELLKLLEDLGSETASEKPDRVRRHTKSELLMSIDEDTLPTKLKRVRRLNPNILASLIGGGLGTVSKVCSKPSDFHCDVDAKYRTVNGTCNNLADPILGSALLSFKRLYPHANYEDDIEEPRLSLGMDDLPSCRVVSFTVVEGFSRENKHVNSMFATFGQFLDHDLSHTTTEQITDKDGVKVTPKCCDKNKHLKNPSKACLPIDVPENDPFYNATGHRCMSLVRSNTGLQDNCRSASREQQNAVSSFIDASHIYGTRPSSVIRLREMKNGRLKVCTDKKGREFPTGGKEKCSQNLDEGETNFVLGDKRAHIQPMLSVLHVIFVREHNRIAAELAELNPSWNDEELYQESRRIMIAIFQRIVYNEFLPLLLGNSVMEEHDLKLDNCGFYENYNPNVDATILNEFATAAYRFGHSLVQSNVQLMEENKNLKSEWLGEKFLKPLKIKLFDDYVRGATNQPSQRMDKNMVKELTNRLFNRPGDPGIDLAAINCQRGRDHGLGTYTDLRDHMGLKQISSFDDLKSVMDPTIAPKFAEVYDFVEDIDLWVGGIAENQLPGSLVGPVFSRIIAEQFKRLRLGDRYWFERGGKKWSFNEDQLEQIRRTSLARILCDNTGVKEMQPLALMSLTELNSRISCESSAIPRMSFEPWKDEPLSSS